MDEGKENIQQNWRHFFFFLVYEDGFEADCVIHTEKRKWAHYSHYTQPALERFGTFTGYKQQILVTYLPSVKCEHEYMHNRKRKEKKKKTLKMDWSCSPKGTQQTSPKYFFKKRPWDWDMRKDCMSENSRSRNELHAAQLGYSKKASCRPREGKRICCYPARGKKAYWTVIGWPIADQGHGRMDGIYTSCFAWVVDMKKVSWSRCIFPLVTLPICSRKWTRSKCFKI